jgi:LysR family transcriptional regulator (chromosome initiation inhibitor)
MDRVASLDLGQLRALSAAVSEGTLEAAARALHVTPSAISQRLRALEVATGRVLLVRSKPVRPTASGEVVLRLARQVELLAGDTLAELDGDATAGDPAVQTLPIAVNADSLATWVLPALATVTGAVSGPVCFDVHRDDEEHTAALLRSGTVVAAVTTDPEAVAGCSVAPLGSMRYRPMASAALARRWFPAGPTPEALAAAPVVVFDRKDDLQHRYLRRRLPDAAGSPPAHHVPSSADFLTAIRLGLGWGMVPELQVPVGDGDPLLELDPDGGVGVDLYWQQWKLRSPTLDRVAAAVIAAAREHLTR